MARLRHRVIRVIRFIRFIRVIGVIRWEGVEAGSTVLLVCVGQAVEVAWWARGYVVMQLH